jgi:hypothetical protein
MSSRTKQTVYSIGEQHDDHSFARTYMKACDDDFAACSTCGRAWRIRPNSSFHLIWNTSKQGNKVGQLGDFTWHRSDDCVLLSDRLRRIMEPYLNAVTVRDIAYEDDFEVPNQNSGKPLWEVTDLPIASVDIEATGARLMKVCPECGDKTYNFNSEMVLTVDRSSWDNWDLFTLREFDVFFITQRVLDAIERARATNYRIRREAVIGER